MNANYLEHCEPIPCATEQEWLEARKQGIGGSDAPSVVGLSDYAGPLTVWCDKRGLSAPKETTRRMRAGSLLEEAVAARYTNETGQQVVMTPGREREDVYDVILRSRERPWQLATIDRWHAGEELVVVELKTTAVYNKKRFLSEGIPRHHYAQVQHQLAVTGAQRAVEAVLFLGDEALDLVDSVTEWAGKNGFDPEQMLKSPAQNWHFLTFDIERDEELIAEINAAEEKLWDFVWRGVEPAPNEFDNVVQIAKAIWPSEEVGKKIEIPGSLLADYYRAKDARDKALKEFEELDKQVRLLMRDAEVGTCEGIPVFSYKVVRRHEKLRMPRTVESRVLRERKRIDVRHYELDPADELSVNRWQDPYGA